jgi:signal transduction histidine kinase
MDIFSLKIIIFIASGISVIMGLYMLFLHNSAKSVKGPAYWAVGNLLIGAGLLLRLLIQNRFFTSHAEYMMFITVGLYVYLAGIWSFKEKEFKKWLLIGFPAFDVIQIFVFYYIFPLMKVRLTLHIAVLSIFSIISIYEMLKLDPEKKYLRKIFRLNAFSFAAFLVTLIGGLVFVAYQPKHQMDAQYAWIIAFGIAGGLMTALTFGFLSAVNLQLNMELQEQLKTKNKFFSIISHDLRSPVGTLMGFVNILNSEENLDEKQRMIVMNNLEILSQSTFHLLHNLMEWANNSKNIAQFEEESIDMNALIISNIKFFQSLMLLKAIRLEFEHDEDVFVNGNPKMIETIIRNLVSNAIKFTPRDGQITITLRKNLKGIQLTVADTGVGIEPKRLDQIFKIENISTTNGTNGESGSGLGLALCKDFVIKNRGTIRVESEVNAGTRFTIDFPVAERVKQGI